MVILSVPSGFGPVSWCAQCMCMHGECWVGSELVGTLSIKYKIEQIEMFAFFRQIGNGYERAKNWKNAGDEPKNCQNGYGRRDLAE